MTDWSCEGPNLAWPCSRRHLLTQDLVVRSLAQGSVGMIHVLELLPAHEHRPELGIVGVAEQLIRLELGSDTTTRPFR